jgi:hypothetical protein
MSLATESSDFVWKFIENSGPDYWSRRMKKHWLSS